MVDNEEKGGQRGEGEGEPRFSQLNDLIRKFSDHYARLNAPVANQKIHGVKTILWRLNDFSISPTTDVGNAKATLAMVTLATINSEKFKLMFPRLTKNEAHLIVARDEAVQIYDSIRTKFHADKFALDHPKIIQAVSDILN